MTNRSTDTASGISRRWMAPPEVREPRPLPATLGDSSEVILRSSGLLRSRKSGVETAAIVNSGSILGVNVTLDGLRNSTKELFVTSLGMLVFGVRVLV